MRALCVVLAPMSRAARRPNLDSIRLLPSSPSLCLRRSQHLKIPLLFIVLGALSAACASTPPPVTPSPRPATPAAASPSPAASPVRGAELQHVWTTRRVTQEEMEDTMRAAGLHEWIQPFRNLHADSPWRAFTLNLNGGKWVGSWEKASDPPREQMDGPFPLRIEGNTLVYGPPDWSTTLEWSIDGDTLMLDFIETSGPGAEGIPEEVYVRAFYTSAPFEKQD
jgi:hypothetical protein